jgi:hypothetical protein
LNTSKRDEHKLTAKTKPNSNNFTQKDRKSPLSNTRIQKPMKITGIKIRD